MFDTNAQIVLGLGLFVVLLLLIPFIKDHKDAKERRATEQTNGAKVRALVSRYWKLLNQRG